MTDTQLTIIITAIPMTLAAVGALAVTIISAIKGEKRGAKAEKAKVETATAIKEVHTIVNDRSTVQAAKIDSLEQKIEALVADRAEMKQVAALLAQAARPPEPTRPGINKP